MKIVLFKTSFKLLLVVILVLGLLSGYCYAQSASPQSGGGDTLKASSDGHWRAQPSCSLYAQYTDNVDLLPTQPLSAWRTQIAPALTFVKPLPRKQMKMDLNLKVDYRHKEGGTTETFTWYNIYGYLGHEVSSRTAYEFSSSLNVGYTQSTVGTPFVNAFGSLDRSISFKLGPAVRYDLTRTTVTKASYEYVISNYSGEGSVNASEHVFSGYLEQKLGSRVLLDLGGIYSIKEISNNTGYNDIQVPFGATVDLTYATVRVGGLYLRRDFNDSSGFKEEKRLGLQGSMTLGGKLLRLRATSVEFTYNTNYYNDIHGDPYENQEFKLGVYHAFRKYDLYLYGRYGNNDYMQKADYIDYIGYGVRWKWRVNNLTSLQFTFDQDEYDYQPDGRDYTIYRYGVEYEYYLYDWMMTGCDYRHTGSDSNQSEGNYEENQYSVFVKAVW